MTTASKGLAAALGRSASGTVVAIAEMSPADLMASMSDDQKAELAAQLAPPAAAANNGANAEDMPPNKKDGCSEDGDEDDEGGDSDPESGMKPKKGAEASTDRVKAVAAAVDTDPACKGKASLALSMLADDEFAGLSASGIVKILGMSDVSDAGANASEAVALAEMKAALSETGNSNIEANVPPAGGAAANSNSVWDKAIARVCAKPAN